MNSTWRRQFLTNLPALPQQDQARESAHLQTLNNYIKALRRKQDLLFRTCDVMRRNDQQMDMQIHLSLLRKELERQRQDETELVRQLEQGGAAPSRTVLYSVFSRMVEILEISKHRIGAVDSRQASLIDLERKSICECYNRLVSEGNYDVVALVQHANKASIDRTFAPFVLKAKIGHFGHPGQHQSTGEISPHKKRSSSEATLRLTNPWFRPPVSNFLEILTARKLQIKELKDLKKKKKEKQPKVAPEAATPQPILSIVQRLKQKPKIPPIKPKPKRKIFSKLYSVLSVRNIFLQQIYTDCDTPYEASGKLFEDCSERNIPTQMSIDEFKTNYSRYQQKREERANRMALRASLSVEMTRQQPAQSPQPIQKPPQ